MASNVLLIVCDTMRKDILGLYGGDAKTPSLKLLAKDAMVYENAIAPSPWTYPSHVSLFTGLYPSQHGVHETDKIKLLGLTKYHRDLRAERLAERFSENGYATDGLSTNIMVSPFTAFDIGFQSFVSLDPIPKMREKWASELFLEARKLGPSPGAIAAALLKHGKFKELYRYAKAWTKIRRLEKVSNYPLDKGAYLINDIFANSKWGEHFFKFINFVEMHEPYVGYKPKETWDDFTGIRSIGRSKAKHLKKQYILEAEYLDSQLGEIISTLKRRGVYDDTMLIITSDHGQAFNEHGYMYHNTYLYDEITRIPMIIKYPKSRKFPKRNGYQSLVNLSDLIKSILEGGNDSALTKETAFSEAYGDVTILPGGYKDRRAYVKQKYEKVRKAIYNDRFKLTVNGTDGRIEEFLENGRSLDPKDRSDVVKGLLNRLEGFKGKENFKMPEV